MFRILNVFLMLTVLALLCPAAVPVQATTGTDNNLLQFTSDGHVLGFAPGGFYVAAGDHALKVEFVNASTALPVAQTAGNSQDAASRLGTVTYKNAWQGIDIECSSAAGGIAESTYIIHPGGDPSQISLRYNVPLEFTPQGGLKLTFQNGYMTESTPSAWQEISGARVPVDVHFVKQGEAQAGFSLGLYDADSTVYIDPVYVWHTFYGSTDQDFGTGVAVDAAGNIYVTGSSVATWNGPGGIAPLNPFTGGGVEIFVVKMNSAGAYQWHTFYGSTSGDNGRGIAVDASGNVYVVGLSFAAWNGPNARAPLNTYAGSTDIVVLKLSSAGAYQWHTFYGSSGSDVGTGVALDAAGNVYVTGSSVNAWDGPGAISPRNPFAGSGDWDIFILKLSSAGAYQWHTFYGSEGDDQGNGIAVDASGNVYVSGYCAATWDGPGAISPRNTHAGGLDIVAIKLNSTGDYQWHTFYGSTGNDFGRAITVDASGNVYVTGYCVATWDGPGAIAPLNPFAGGMVDIIVIKLSGAGAYQWHTFYGSTGDDYGFGITVDSAGNACVTGYGDTAWNGPGARSPLNPFAGGQDIVVINLSGAGAYQWHTFYGSTGADQAYAIAADASNNLCMTGNSSATWNGPGARSPLNPFAGINDMVFVKMSEPPTLTTVNPANGTQRQSLAVTITGTNLKEATAVSFGDGITVSRFTANSNTQITANIVIAPNAKMGNRHVVVTTPAGRATKADAFKVRGEESAANTPRGSGSMPATPPVAPVSLSNISVQGATLSTATVSPNTPVTVTANIANKSTVNGTRKITVYVNGEIETVQGVSLDSGSTSQLTFNVSRSEPGTYSVYVDGANAGSFTVDQFADPNTILYISGALLVFAFIIGLIFISRRRQTGH